jgi:protein-tyrosine-phosphatase
MKNILFVCVENSCRSQIAEAFATIYGQGIASAYSSGSKPSGIVNPKAIVSMHELDYDLTKHSSKSLDEIPQIEYDFAITMGCGDECPFVRAKNRDDWNIPDPKNMTIEEFRIVRDEIKTRVLELLESISSEHTTEQLLHS